MKSRRSDDSAGYPSGLTYIIGNEAAERFSYYGMKAILVVYMTTALRDSSGQLDLMSEAQAKAWYHYFSAANYFFPILGALVADILWGKYRTIITLSLVYCLGHAVLAAFETRMGLATGLLLIAIGAGGIKPCVSAHVGDQFSARNAHLIEKMFSFFYLAINLGAFFSTILTPILLERFGPGVAFGVPGIFMLLATVTFWSGRNRFIAIPPVPWKEYKAKVFSPSGLTALRQLLVLYLFISVFWSLFDQIGSSWVLQAERMNRTVDLSFGIPALSMLQFDLLAAQVQALNPIFILVLVPIFTYGIYPALGKVMKVTPLRKIAFGMLLAALSFTITGYAEAQLDSGQSVSIIWQCLAMLVLTISEIMVSITALEFSYTQAPHAMKSFIMGAYFLSVSLGNLLAAFVNQMLVSSEGLPLVAGARYFYLFAALMTIAAILFALAIRFYREQTFLHGSPAEEQ